MPCTRLQGFGFRAWGFGFVLPDEYKAPAVTGFQDFVRGLWNFLVRGLEYWIPALSLSG